MMLAIVAPQQIDWLVRVWVHAINAVYVTASSVWTVSVIAWRVYLWRCDRAVAAAMQELHDALDACQRDMSPATDARFQRALAAAKEANAARLRIANTNPLALLWKGKR